MNLSEIIDQDRALQLDLVSSGLDGHDAMHLSELRRNPNVKAALVLRAFGVPGDMIQESLELTPETIEQSLLIPELKDFYSDWSIKIKSSDSDAALDRLVPVAIFVQESLLNSPQTAPALKAKLSQDILDRVKGRAKQSLEVRSTSINVTAKESQLTDDLASVMGTIKKLEAERDVIRNAKEAVKV